MLSEYFQSADRIRAIRGGPAGELIEHFSAALFQSGYAKVTGTNYIRAAEHFVRWTTGRGISVSDLDDEALRRFGRHLDRCHCGRYAGATRREVLGGARLFLRCSQGVIEPAIRERRAFPADPVLLRDFREWMREQRGTCDLTIDNYSIPIRALIRRCGEDPSKLDARGIRQFVLAHSSGSRWTATRCTTALRMFLRFLIAKGQCRVGLLGAIPVMAHWRLAPLPKYLPSEDVERIIEPCEASTPAGKCDRAILLLLARLGLRAGDIVQMRFRDVDWKGGWIQVTGKSRRQTRLPLSREVGEALVEYLQHGRPRTSTDALFLRSRAPYRGLRAHPAVSVIVASAMRRAGVTRPARGAAHLLRHSIASSMLRHGASLQDISALLRHRSVETTAIYAKVDVLGLRQIAQPWPEAQP